MTALMREMALYHSVLRKKIEEEQKTARANGAAQDDSKLLAYVFVSSKPSCSLTLVISGLNEQESPRQPSGGPAGKHGRLRAQLLYSVQGQERLGRSVRPCSPTSYKQIYSP